MTVKVVRSLKYLGLFFLVFFTITSCEKEIESVGVNLVENNNFNTGGEFLNVIANTVNVENVQSNGLAQYLLGVYADEELGSLKASITTKLILPNLGESYSNYFGTNVAIDYVNVDIPYKVILQEGNLEQLIAKNLLVNDTTLKCYIGLNTSTTLYLDQLYLYNNDVNFFNFS